MFRSQKKAWQDLAADINAEFIYKGRFKPYEVLKKGDGYDIKLDSFTHMAGNTPITTTRLQSSCLNAKDFRFLIKRKHFLNKIAPKGLELIQTDYQEFDQLFRLFASNKRKIKEVLNRKIIYEISTQKSFKKIRIELKDGNLEFKIKTLVKDIEQLKLLFKLMESIQQQLHAKS